MNDPNGEADMVNGGYVNHTNGKGIATAARTGYAAGSPMGPPADGPSL
jgi:hypothetical protein